MLMIIIIINVMRIISNFCIKNVTIKQEIIEYISEQVPNTQTHLSRDMKWRHEVPENDQ